MPILCISDSVAFLRVRRINIEIKKYIYIYKIYIYWRRYLITLTRKRIAFHLIQVSQKTQEQYSQNPESSATVL